MEQEGDQPATQSDPAEPTPGEPTPGTDTGAAAAADASAGNREEPGPEPALAGTPTPPPTESEASSLGPSEVWVHRSGAGKVRRPVDTVQNLDFRNPTAFSAAMLRSMRTRHEEFVRALSARLSLYLRMEFSLRLGKLETLPYRTFTSSLPEPTHLTLFRIEPLPGISLVGVPPRLAMTVVDRLLGGPAQALTTDHTPSEIELALLSQAVQVIVSEWAGFWSGPQELSAVILGYENNGRYLRTSPHDTVMLVLSLEARLGDCEESIQIAFPHYTIEPLASVLSRSSEKSESGAPAVRTDKVAWNPRFSDVPVSITAEWEGVELTARELANLKVGDVVDLDGSCVEEVKVRLAEVLRFKGRLGAAGDRLAVELVENWKQ